jgi:hypothetical protein
LLTSRFAPPPSPSPHGEGARLLFAAIAFALAACSAPAPSGDLAARVAQLEDEREIARVATALDDAVDRKDWPAARALLADTVNADFSSLGAAAGPLAADALIDAWRRGLHPQKVSVHLRAGGLIAIDRDGATMISHGFALNALPQRMANQYWEGWGRYEHHFVRTAGGWRIDGLRFTLTAERGDPGVRLEQLPPESD